MRIGTEGGGTKEGKEGWMGTEKGRSGCQNTMKWNDSHEN